MILQKPFNERTTTMELRIEGVPVDSVPHIVSWLAESTRGLQFTVKYDFCPHDCYYCAGWRNVNLCHNTDLREYYKIDGDMYNRDGTLSDSEYELYDKKEEKDFPIDPDKEKQVWDELDKTCGLISRGWSPQVP